MIARAARLAALLTLLSVPLAVAAQPAGGVHRIGLLTPTIRGLAETAFREGLRTLGYVEGQSILVEYRSAEGRFERLPELAAELVRLKVEVLVTAVTQASLAAKGATRTVPIVFVAVGDPVAAGLVTNLARPGANLTGTALPNVEVAGKSLEALKEMLPALRRAAVLRNPANLVFQAQMVTRTEAAAKALGVELRVLAARDLGEIEAAFEVMARERAEALVVTADPLVSANLARIAALALRGRLPSVSTTVEYAEAGGLMAYGPSFREPGLRAAVQVDRILKGAKPADLPVEQATQYVLALNLKTAKTLGLAIPASLATRADRVIE